MDNNSLAVTCSIRAVAEAGVRLSLILNAITCEMPDALTEVLTISRNVTLFASLLKQTANMLEVAEPVHSREAVRAAGQVTTEGNSIFEEIDTMLAKVKSRKDEGTEGLTMQQRFGGEFKETKVDYLLAQLDSLKMSLSLMLQIIQLGATMASTSRIDPPETVEIKTKQMQRERVEAQNMVMVHYFQGKEVSSLYQRAMAEQQQPKRPSMSSAEHQRESSDLGLTKVETQISIVADAPLTTEPATMVRSPKNTLAELDQAWVRMSSSQEDLVRVSEEVTHHLVDTWTEWRRLREEHDRQRGRLGRDSRYRSVVQDYDEDELSSYHDTLERDASPHHRYLEGPTTDWRQPHSAEARKRAAQLRRQYSGYQPSVSAASSDVDDSPGSVESRKRTSRRHVINSDQESSESEPEKFRKPQRRGSAVQSHESRPREADSTPLSKSFSTVPVPPMGSRNHQPVTPPNGRPIPPGYSSPQYRPYPASDQGPHPRALSSTNIKPSGQYQPPSSSSTTLQPPLLYTQQLPGYSYPPPSHQSARHAPRMSGQGTRHGQPRPGSRDGPPPRSPSRLPHTHPPPVHREHSYSYPSQSSARSRQAKLEEEEAHRKQVKRKLGDRAAKGLLAGGGIAVLLEALDAI